MTPRSPDLRIRSWLVDRLLEQEPVRGSPLKEDEQIAVCTDTVTLACVALTLA